MAEEPAQFADLFPGVNQAAAAASQEANLADQSAGDAEEPGDGTENATDTDSANEERDELDNGQAGTSEAGDAENVEKPSKREVELEAKLEKSENQRRGFQAEANRAQADLKRAATDVHSDRSSGKSKQDETIDSILFNAQEEGSVTPNDLAAVIQMLREGNAEKDAQTAKKARAGAENAAAGSKKDLRDVVGFLRDNNLGNDPDYPLLNNLGQYYMGLSKMLEAENKKLKEEQQSKPAPKPNPNTKKAGSEKQKAGSKGLNVPTVGGKTQKSPPAPVGESFTHAAFAQRQKNRLAQQAKMQRR